MQDSNIIKDSQITISDITSQISGLRTSPIGSPSSLPLSTMQDVLNITIKLTNNDYPTSPQLGKIDFIESESVNIDTFEVYFKLPGSNDFVPFNTNPLDILPEKFNVDENVVFPDNTFVDEVYIIINKDQFSSNETMEIKLDIFACFELKSSYKLL